MIRNMPTPEGIALGRELARLCDGAEIEARKRFPDHAERCKSCAFRAGTRPNGCPPTVLDALKAAMECVPFYCHLDMDEDGKPTELCAGWVAMMLEKDRPTRAPWEWSIQRETKIEKAEAKRRRKAIKVAAEVKRA